MIYLVLMLVLLAIDQLIKWIVVSNMVLGQSIELMGILKLTLVHNYGASFGILSGKGEFIIITTVIIIAVVVLLWRKDYMIPYRLPLAVVMGGAIGNLIDRISRGYVVDYIDFTYWPVFNFADSCVVLAVIFLSYKILRS